MRVVVTGGAGFIGANLCRALVDTDGIQPVVAYDNLSTGSKDNLADADGVELVEADVCDRRALDEAFEGVGAVFHLAARPSVPKSIADPVASHVANVTGTLEVLEAARRAGRPHLIAASSSSVYGANPTLPKHEDLKPSPLSPYAAMKLAAETYTLAWGQSYAMDVLALRLERSEDVEEPSRTSLLGLIAVLEEVVGRSLERRHGERRVGDVQDSQADASRLRLLFPDLEPVPLVEGIRTTVAWFRGQQTRWPGSEASRGERRPALSVTTSHGSQYES